MMTDSERLTWLEKQPGSALINDDAGRWAVVSDGVQNVPNNDKAIDISTTFFIKAADWHPSIRKAIDAAFANWSRPAKRRGKKK